MSSTTPNPEVGKSTQPSKQPGGLRSKQLKEATPLQLAFQYVVVAALVGYGIYGVIADDLIFPFSWGRYPDRHSEWLHFHGLQTWIMLAAFLIAAASAVFWHMRNKGTARSQTRFVIASFVAGALSALMIFVTAAGVAHHWW